jgi:excinuclease UvrABC nuclease subunit
MSDLEYYVNEYNSAVSELMNLLLEERQKLSSTQHSPCSDFNLGLCINACLKVINAEAQYRQLCDD